MSGMLESKPDGLWFSVDDRRYHILSPVRLDGRSQLLLTLALYNGQGEGCLHQDEINISVAKGRTTYARSCQPWDEQTITTDLLDLDDQLRKRIEQEDATQRASSEEPTETRQVGGIEEGEFAYYRHRTERDGTVVRTPLSSFIVIPKVRVWIDGAEAIRAELNTPTQAFPDITLERHHWHSRGLFLKALPSLDLWCVASDNEVQCIQAIIAGKQVPRKHGTRALGYYENIWVTEKGAIGPEGWMADPPVLYLPHGGELPLTGCVRYHTADAAAGQSVATAFYRHVWKLNDLGVIGPMVGWFFATPFKPHIMGLLKHFPIFNCWGTKGAGKTSLLQLFWRLFGVESELLSCTETEFALLSLLSSTTSIPLVFDEFKPWDMRQDQVRRFERILRRVYQGDVEHRGKPDLRLVAYRLTTPVAVAGEVPVTTQPALSERVVPVSPSPHWLAEHTDALEAYATLTKLSLSDFAPLYIRWTLQRDFAQDFAKAQQVFYEVMKEHLLPDRVRHNAMVVIFGLCQFEAFGQAYALEVPEQLDYKAILDPMLEQLCNAEGMTRTAVDDLLEHLSTLAEMGRLNRQQHYTWTPDEAIALRLDLCLAEFRKYARETLLDGEVLNRAAYLRQLRENQRAKGYVKGTSELAYFGQERKRAVLIDPAQAEHTGLDLGGFVR
jgi:hypothetical protein